jgi:hypothetical protein
MKAGLLHSAILGVGVVASLSLGLLIVSCGGGTTTVTLTTAPTTVSTTSTTSPGGAVPTKIVIDLRGDQVLPPAQTNAGGTFTLLVEVGPTGGLDISYQLDVKDIVDASAAHIHLGAAGADGPVIVPLFDGPPKSGTFSGTLASGTISEADLTGPMQGKTFQELAGAVLTGQTYVNVHTDTYPNGEIRGQIVLSVPGVTSTTAASGGAPTETTLGGAY